MKAYRLFSEAEALEIAGAITGWAPGKASKAVAVTKRNEESREEKPYLDEIVKRIWASPIPKAHFVEKVSEPKFNRYRNGGEYAIHTDAARIRDTRTDLACTLFLSSDYSGGALCVQGHQVQLTPGEVLVYDCWRPHRVEPVTEGERVACIWWMQSYIRNEDERDLLNMLHSVIADERDEAKFAKLGAVHEKLVKMWWN